MNDALISAVNGQHGLHLTLGERYPRGEQGAFAVQDAAGASFVLKWSIDPGMLERTCRARLFTEGLRDEGYPAPRYRFQGVVDDVYYSLQEALPGQPIGTVSHAHLPRLLELNALQRGASPLPASGWPQWIVSSVLDGFDGYCVLTSLEGYSLTTQVLLAEVQSLAARYTDVACPTTDIVHFDFNPANILADDDRISGVVDWDGATSGDCAFDLVTLLFYTRRDHDARRTLWRYLGTHSRPGAVSLYLAHLIVRQVDWSIRHHDPETVDLWLGVADTLLKELGQWCVE